MWSARRILESNNDSSFAFPLYTNEKMTNSNSASAALNKWLRNRLGEGNAIHGFRHSMRDRLRAVECPFRFNRPDRRLDKWKCGRRVW